jgi:hypothetical protein
LGFFDGSYNLPLIIKDPRPSADITRGCEVSRHYTEAVDVFPTICEAFGLAVPAQVDGRSLLSFLDGRRNDNSDVTPAQSGWRDSAHWEWDFRDDAEALGTSLGVGTTLNPYDCALCVLRGPRFKYVQFGVDCLPPLLYDLVRASVFCLA